MTNNPQPDSNRSNRPAKILVATASTVLILGLVWSHRHANDSALNKPNEKSSRSPASHRSDPAKQQTMEKHQHRPPEGKAGVGIDVTVSADDGSGGALKPAVNQKYDLMHTKVRLKGTITADREISGHEYNWIFPQTYSVVEGSATGTIPNLKPGQVHEVSIVLDRVQSPEQPVVLHVFQIINSEPRGTVVQFDFPVSSDEETRGPAEMISETGLHKNEKFVQ